MIFFTGPSFRPPRFFEMTFLGASPPPDLDSVPSSAPAPLSSSSSSPAAAAAVASGSGYNS